MLVVGERVARIEGRVEEQSKMIASWQSTWNGFEEKIDRRFDAVDRRFDAVERRFVALEDRMSRQFVWLVGFHVTTLAAIILALSSR